jgi:hypothetical protein
MMWSIFVEIWLQINLVFKNGIRNGPGRLVKALEHLFSNLAPNRPSFQK